jgi:hypothetical protein
MQGKSSGLADKRFLKRAERVCCLFFCAMPVEMKQLFRLFITMHQPQKIETSKNSTRGKLIAIYFPSDTNSQPLFCRFEPRIHSQYNIGFRSLGLSLFSHFFAAKKQRKLDMQPASSARARFPFTPD